MLWLYSDIVNFVLFAIKLFLVFFVLLSFNKTSTSSTYMYITGLREKMIWIDLNIVGITRLINYGGGYILLSMEDIY